MKIINALSLYFAVCLLLVGCNGVEKENIENSYGLKLVWSDEFDNPVLNEENWNIEINGNGGGNNELQYYRKENISIGKAPNHNESCLIITATKEPFEGKPANSGRLTTLNKFDFLYGRIEARIMLPKTADGLWPAFWMMGSDIQQVGWPACGELDIMEMGNSYGIKNNCQETFMNGACHWGKMDGSSHPYYAMDGNAPYSVQDGKFHLYTLIWSENDIKCYLDLDIYPEVEPYFSMCISDKSDPSNPGNYFNKPNFILLNLAVGVNFTGIWDIEKITAF